MITDVDVRNRVMALCERIQLPGAGPSHAYRDEEDCSFAPSDLPAFVVKISPRGHDIAYANANTTYATTVDITIGLYVSHVGDESYNRDMDARDAANIAAAYVVDYFAARPTLSMDYDGGIADEARIVRWIGPHTMPTDGSEIENRGAQFRMPVTYRNTREIDDE